MLICRNTIAPIVESAITSSSSAAGDIGTSAVAAGAADTVSVALAAAAEGGALALVTEPAGNVLTDDPSLTGTTDTDTLQLPFAGIDPPESINVDPPASAVTVPPQLLVTFGTGAFARPAG